MLPLPTEAAVAMNVFTDRLDPFHTYNDRNRFRQFGFTQQNIVVEIDDGERDMEISNGKGTLIHWRLGYSQCFSVISTFWYNSLILQHKQPYLFLSYFSSLAIIQKGSSLAWEVVQKYVHGWTRIMEPLCRWFIELLTFRTKCSNHCVVFFFLCVCIFFNDAVGWQFYRHQLFMHETCLFSCLQFTC